MDGGSHHWARRLTAMGYRVRLIPPQYVKPFVKRSKTDRADAEAICEAAGLPSMRLVPAKTAERQGEIMVLRTRELLVRSRTQAVNALRGHATEFGLVVPLGVPRVEELLAKLAADPGVPEVAREMLALLGRQIEQIDAHWLRSTPGCLRCTKRTRSAGAWQSCPASGRSPQSALR